MAGSPRSDPLAARRTIVQLGGNSLQDVFHQRPSFHRTSGHHRRAVQGSFLASRNSGSDEIDPFLFQLLHTTFRVVEVRIASVDNYIARRKEREQLRDQLVYRTPRFDHHHDDMRTFHRVDQLFDRMRSDKTFAFAPAIDKTVYDSLFAGYAPVIYGNRETFALHIERQVLAHHGKPDQSYICFHISVVFMLNSI